MSVSLGVPTTPSYNNPTPPAVSTPTGTSQKPLRDGFVHCLSSTVSCAANGTTGKQIAARAAQMISLPADSDDSEPNAPAASPDDPVETAARHAARIDAGLREMGNAYNTLWSTWQMRSGLAASAEERRIRKSHGDDVRYIAADLAEAEAVAVNALPGEGMDPQSTEDTIGKNLKKADEEVSRLARGVHCRMATAYAQNVGGKTTININAAPAPAGLLPAPLAEAATKAANWLADKVKGNVVAAFVTKALAGLALILTWAVPVALTALSIVIPPIGIVTGPLALATGIAAPLLSQFFGALWAGLSPAREPVSTASIDLNMRLAGR